MTPRSRIVHSLTKPARCPFFFFFFFNSTHHFDVCSCSMFTLLLLPLLKVWLLVVVLQLWKGVTNSADTPMKWWCETQREKYMLSLPTARILRLKANDSFMLVSAALKPWSIAPVWAPKLYHMWLLIIHHAAIEQPSITEYNLFYFKSL